MSRYTPTGGLTGIALLDERITLDTLSDTSDYTQSGPRPGQDVPEDAKTDLVVQIAGEQSVDLTVKALTAGMPGGTRPCRLGYYPTSEGATKIRGWNPPNVLMGWSAGEYAAAASAEYGPASACVIPSSQLIVVTYAQSTGGGKTLSRTYDPFTATWGSQITIDDTSTPSSNVLAACCCLPGTERVLTLRSSESGAGSVVYFSDDEGATWETYADGTLDTALNVTSRYRSRLLVVGDDLLYILVGDFSGTTKLAWYASSDLGCSFQEVVRWSSPGGVPDVIALPSGKIGLIRTDGSGYLQWRSVGSAWDDISGATDVVINGSIAIGEMAAYTDPDGVIWVLGRGAGAATDAVYVWRSDDEGATWVLSDFGLSDSSDTSTSLKNFTPVAAAGAGWLFHQWNANPGDEDNGLAVAQLGGWSSACLSVDHFSSAPTSDADQERAAFGPTSVSGVVTVTWLPFDEPGDCGWTAAGAGTDSLTSGFLEVVTSANARSYTPPTAVGTTHVQFVGLFDLKTVSGGSLTASDIAIECDISDGTRGHSVAIRISASGFRIRDLNAGTDKATISLTTTTPFQILLGIRHPSSAAPAQIDVLYRRPGAAAWSVGYVGTIAESVSITTGRLVWGNIASGTATSAWRMANLAYGPVYNVGFTHPDSYTDFDRRMIGRKISALPVPLGDSATDGASFLRALDGPARVGEVHALRATYDYGIDRLFPLLSPSPDEGWRSTDDEEHLIAFIPSSQGVGTETALGRSRSIVVGFFRANFRTAYLEASHDGVSWTTLGEYDGATGFTGLTASVNGDQVSPNTSSTSTASRFLQRGELVGGVALVNGTGAYIETQEEGLWTQTATRRPRLTVDRAVTAGSTNLIAPNGLLVVHGVNTVYEQWRIRIPVQDVPDGIFRLGALFLGGLAVTGLPWDWGWTQELRPNTRESTNRYGTSRRRQDGPPRRILSFAWAGGVPLQRLRTGTPDYYSPDASLQALAAVRDVPWLLDGLTREGRGGERPCVALQFVPETSTYQTITDPSLFVYGRLSGSVQRAHVAGRANVSELLRVETLSVEEIV